MADIESAQRFLDSYAATPPWDIGRPQPALQAVSDQFTGRVLDVGCGTGEHALLAASLGLDATGIDAAPTAIERAKKKAGERDLSARFIVGNALELGSLDEQFDTIVDSGLFHVFSDDERARYVASLAAALAPGGRYFMLCFSDSQPGDWGPRRVTETEIRGSFADGWRVDDITATQLEINEDPEVPAGPVDAWRVAATRL
ncbi:class I SAM-dependent methyltransferase [Skermania sp. ID1734]|uniref:class I SAM-dependent methyltransferase n=1 Tax=Skermania sp. ID1734 TaxID=2597516 RepID=UPI00118098EB|nr:class I SAM-dependent methyltransferase [Skermania sp. ID1734]TSD99333.1 class I SAM-dependent methyltransferase [Skermania sp. ID1734]